MNDLYNRATYEWARSNSRAVRGGRPAGPIPELPLHQPRRRHQRARALGSLDVSTFYDRAALNPGQPWFDELEAALRQVCGVAVFIGREGLGTIQKREMQFALNRQAAEERAGRRFPVIPVLLQGVDLEAVSGFLALNTWVDLRRQLDDRAALGGFVNALGRQAPSAAPETASVPPFGASMPFVKKTPRCSSAARLLRSACWLSCLNATS